MAPQFPSPQSEPRSGLSRRAVLATGVGTALAAGSLPAIAQPLPPGGHRILPVDTTDPLWTDRVLLDTSFDDGDPEWLTRFVDGERVPVPEARYDTGSSHTSATSLRYDVATTTPYGVLCKRFPTEPGRYYSATVWTRSKDLVGPPHRGAMVAFQGYKADGGWIETAATGGQPTPETWYEHSVRYRTPGNAAVVEIALYLFRGMTGTAWFDDLVVTEHAVRAITTSLVSPSFRGLLIPNDHDQIEVRTIVDSRVGSEYRIRTTLFDADDQVVVTSEVTPASEVTFTHPAAGLAPGRYRVLTEAVSDTATIGAEEWAVEKVATVPSVWTDRHGRYIRDGEPHFPLGMYTSQNNPRSIADLAGTPFNTMLSYVPLTASDMDDAADNNIQIIYPLNTYFADSPSVHRPAGVKVIDDEVPEITATVEEFRDHPALLGWYLGDELRIEQYGAQLAAHHEAVVSTDPDHVTFSVDNKEPIPGADYMRTADIFGMDSYPVFEVGSDKEELPEPQRLARAMAREIPHRAVWHVPQSFSWGARVTTGVGRFPTAHEFRNVCWQMIVEGATGLIWYNLYDMRRDDELIGDAVENRTPFAESMGIATATAQEISDLIPVLLSIEPAPEVTTADREWLNVTTRSHDGRYYLFALNNTRDDHGVVTFEAPGMISASVLGEDRTIAIDGSFDDAFAGLDTHLYELTAATPETVTALVADLASEADSPAPANRLRQIRHHLELAIRHRDAGRDRPYEAQLDRFESLVLGLLPTDDAERVIRLGNHLI